MSPRVSWSASEADPFISGPLAGPSLFTPEELREFQRLAKEHAGADLTADEAQDVATRLLRVLAIVRDVQMKSAEPAKPSLDIRELTLHLRKLQHELELTADHPSSWRWAIMSLHAALRFVLVFHAAATEEQSLARLFDQVSAEQPELPQVQGSIVLLGRLREKCISLGVLRWPVGQDKLRAMCSDCLRVIQRLEPGVATEVRNLEDVLLELS